MSSKKELLDIEIPELGTKCSYNCGSDRYGVEIIKNEDEEYPIIYRKNIELELEIVEIEKIYLNGIQN
jgi:hypothetical protein